MTKLLESACQKLSALPEIEQNLYAKFIILKKVPKNLKKGKTWEQNTKR